jgi:hypothetical protein
VAVLATGKLLQYVLYGRGQTLTAGGGWGSRAHQTTLPTSRVFFFFFLLQFCGFQSFANFSKSLAICFSNLHFKPKFPKFSKHFCSHSVKILKEKEECCSQEKL